MLVKYLQIKNDEKQNNFNKMIEKQNYLIQSFSKIGLPEPFSDEGEQLKISNKLRHAIERKFQEKTGWKLVEIKEPKAEECEKLVYDIERYEGGVIPQTIYLPSDQTMLKLMRACIGVKHPSLLWCQPDFTNYLVEKKISSQIENK